MGLEPTWRAFANTDRFNRAAGLGFRFEEAARPDGTVVRHGEARKLGLRLRWEELPFEFTAPTGFRSERVFPSGPLARLVTTVQLEEQPDGTRIDYRVELFPSSGLLRPLVALDAATSTRPTLTRTLERLLRSLEGHAPLDPPPPLSEEGEQRLAAWVARVEPRPVGEALARLIRSAPLDVQDRLRPLAVADELGLAPAVVIRAFLDGVRAGVLELRWELLCPSCHGPKAHAPRLGAGPATVHCGSCNIQYDAAFPDHVAVTFRPSPAVRRFEVPVDCLLSPSRTPHVLGQATVRGWGEVRFDVRLQPGGYRLDTHPALGAALIEVRDGLPDHELVVDLTDDGPRPKTLRVAPGPRAITVRSRIGRSALLTLQRRWLPPWTLTAGHLLEDPATRDLLPADALDPSLAVEVRDGAVLAVCPIDEERLGPLRLAAEAEAVADGVALLAFPTLEDAVRAARVFAGEAFGVGLAAGPVARLSRGGAPPSPGGRTVERALEAMRSLGGRRIGLHVADKRPNRERLDAIEGLDPDDPGEFCHLELRFVAERSERIRRRIARTRAPPTRCGAFVVRGELARGAQGLVLEAVHETTGAPAVIKVLVPQLAEDPEAVQRFWAEAHVTARLDHPHVVHLLDWGETDDGQLYMALERLRGEPLDRVLARGPLPAPLVVTLGRQALDALGAAHAARILHRDLKPGNLFLVEGPAPWLKVLDFGIAHRLGDEVDIELVLGTPAYMSPEQVESDPLDARSDLYALGVVLYECLAGRLPFDGDQDFVIAMQRVHRDPHPLSETAPAVPAAVAAVVMRALELDPPRRWPDAGAMQAALAGAADGR